MVRPQPALSTQLHIVFRHKWGAGIQVLELYRVKRASTSRLQVQAIHIPSTPYSHNTPNRRVATQEPTPADSPRVTTAVSYTDRSRYIGTGCLSTPMRSIPAARMDYSRPRC